MANIQDIIHIAQGISKFSLGAYKATDNFAFFVITENIENLLQMALELQKEKDDG